MSNICSFAPISNPAANVLILGSMPGRESLRAGQYYAHPRNAFWPIMGDLIGAKPALSYEARTELLKANNIALWDVLASCNRHSSLDADIDAALPNDFRAFFLAHLAITHVFFNGAIAEKYFHKLVQGLPESRQLQYQRLPSTSPANAAVSYNQKLDAWKVIMQKTLQ